MKFKYEVENIFPSALSPEEIKEIICNKIVKIIIFKENNYYDNR